MSSEMEEIEAMSSTPQAPDKNVLEAAAPVFSTKEAAKIAKQAFGIQASAHPLGSERDQNFHLLAGDGREWVL